MADPFEVRLRFTNLLSHLSASSTASHKTAHYALKHRDMDEDLHSCIIENLERNNLNNRANIMYFLEYFCDFALREDHHAYVDFVRRDIRRIVEAVAQSGANVKVARRVVGGLQDKGVLRSEVVREIEEGLKSKDGGDEGADEQHDEMEVESQKVTPKTVQKVNGPPKLDKRAIEQRIEEDRERNKRLRESVWAVTGDDEQELDKMWDEGSDLNEDDYVLAEEEADERRQFAEYHKLKSET